MRRRLPGVTRGRSIRPLVAGPCPLARLLSVIVVVAVALPASAQSPSRPRLGARADTNDWEAYYADGVNHLRKNPRRAFEAFHWASRLAPWNGDPLYAQWVAFHLQQPGRFEFYLRGEKGVMADPQVQRTDSILRLAYLRNPFVHRTLEIALFDALPGRWGGDVVTRAWLAYAAHNFDQATELFGRAIANDPHKLATLRHLRATLFVASRQFDSARAEMTELLAALRHRDEKELVRVYESKAFYEYAIGRIESVRGNRTAAREAFERALTEDLTYAPAHIGIGALARDHASAAASNAQAVDLMPSDAVYRYVYALSLVKSSRTQEGLDQANRAIALEPYFADSYLVKAAAHEQLAQPDSARLAYRSYLDRASRNAENRHRAVQRLTALESATPTR